MGSAIQKILQGRGDKEGQGFWIKKTIPLLCLVLTWVGLLKDLPATMPVLWFSFSAATAITYSILHFASKRKKASVEFIFSVALIFAGISNALNLIWLKPVYFPLVISASVFYSWQTVVPLSFLVMLLRLKALFMNETFLEEIAFSASLLLTAVISSVMLDRFRKEKGKDYTALETIKDAAEAMPETSTESIDSNEAVSYYFASMLKTDEEIKELLLAIKQAVFANSVNLFMPYQNGFMLRCSTEEKGVIIVTGKGIIAECFKTKKVFYSGEINERISEIGYIKNKKNNKVLSALAVPVMDGYTLTGVLTSDSSIYHAFSEPVRNTVQMFAAHLARILERERIYPKLKRDYNNLEILKEESSKLVSSLNLNVIAEKLCEGAERIASSHAFLFIASGKQFELIHHTGSISGNKTVFDLKSTFINIAVENRQPFYMADMKDYRASVLPFNAGNICSIFIIPLIYESKLLGLFVMSSEKAAFLDTFQRELMEVMCNQAATSIANAKLHAEIEKLATTDGLTGLFNHRVFQEKLSEELKKLSRYSEPSSLLLADIDFFKKINDTYGHPAGDFVLKEVSKIIREAIRDIDIPARYGGEEFAAILPRTDSKGAMNIAERLRKAVMSASFSSDASSLRVTLSIGIATTPSDAKSEEELIEKADHALYYAKHNGRNRSVLWSEIKN
ncbi:MAG: sensor domain-containing diguanylate cyclase [Nitrospirae bacterium]|nr:sensor domain-containing diguanylate cyclase [Nitrospirota bacterium]